MIKKSKEVLVQRSAIQTKIHRLVINIDILSARHKQIQEETERINKERDRIDNGDEFHILVEETSIQKTKYNEHIISCGNHTYKVDDCKHDGNKVMMKTIHLSGGIIEAMEKNDLESCDICWLHYCSIDMNESKWCIINNANICLQCGCLCSKHEIINICEIKK
eukprot:160832_1